MKMKNVINWFDIPATDFDRAVRFYSDILGSDVKVDEFSGERMGFFPMDMESKDGVGGALVPASSDNMPSDKGTRVYLNCSGMIDEVIGRVDAAGGKIIKPKFSIGEWGYVAMIQDTEGNIVGLHSM